MKIILQNLLLSFILSLLSSSVFAVAISDPAAVFIEKHTILAEKAIAAHDYTEGQKHLDLVISRAQETGYQDKLLSALALQLEVAGTSADSIRTNQTLFDIEKLVSQANGVTRANGHKILAEYFMKNTACDKASGHLHVAVNAYRNANQVEKMTQSLLDLGYCDTRVGDLDLAEMAFKEAQHRSIKAKLNYYVALSSLNLARLYVTQNEVSAARRAIKYVEGYLESSESNPDKAHLRIALATLYLDLSRKDIDDEKYRLTAYKHLENLVKKSTELTGWQLHGHALGLIGSLYRDEGRQDIAAEYYEQAVAASRKEPDSLAYLQWNIELAKLRYTLAGNLSIDDFRLAFYEIKENLDYLVAGNEKNFRQLIRPFTESYLDVLAGISTQSNRKEVANEAFGVVDLYKTAELISQFPLRQTDKMSIMPVNKYQANYYSVVTNSHIYVVAKSENNLIFKKIDARRDDLYQSVVTFRQSIDSGNYSESASKKLFDILIKPVWSLLEKSKSIRFNNDGLLRALPMAAIRVNKKYLVEHVMVSYFSSEALGKYRWSTTGDFSANRVSEKSGGYIVNDEIFLSSLARESRKGKSATRFDDVFDGKKMAFRYKTLLFRHSPKFKSEADLLVIPFRAGVETFITPLWGSENVAVRLDKYKSLKGLHQQQLDAIRKGHPPRLWSSIMAITI